MTRRRTPPPPAPATGRAWQRTRPSRLPDEVSARPQAPLKEVIKGLDARELEGETVFDQLFGPPEPP